jgi:hypothetical protein
MSSGISGDRSILRQATILRSIFRPRLMSNDLYHIPIQSMSAILLERLLYRRAGIVGPIRTYLTAVPRTGFSEGQAGLDKDTDPGSSNSE